MKYRHLTKARKGTLAWIDISRNPQKSGDEVLKYVNSIIGMTTFTDPAHGIASLLKVKYYDDIDTIKTGHITEIVKY